MGSLCLDLIDASLIENITGTLYDINGRRIKLNTRAEGNLIDVSIGQKVNPGLYFFNVKDDSQVYKKMIIVD